VEPGGARIEACFATLNAGPLGSFRITTQEMTRMKRYAAQRQLEILALYHTHPSGMPNLSVDDRHLLTYSQIAWVVVTFNDTGTDMLQLHAYAPSTAEMIPINIVE
jgi:proteasome lid subunit RPN8/RPN11